MDTKTKEAAREDEEDAKIMDEATAEAEREGYYSWKEVKRTELLDEALKALGTLDWALAMNDHSVATRQLKRAVSLIERARTPEREG